MSISQWDSRWHKLRFIVLSCGMELQTNGYRFDTGRFTYETVSAILKHPYTRQLSTKADIIERELTKTNRFYPLPSELKQDEFLANLFTPRNGIKELCDYLIGLIKDISTLYRKEGEYNDIFNQLYRESLFQSFLKINRLYSLIESGELNIQPHTLKRLISKVLTSSNIPFHGEPAIGMQVMGVLETRNLDFRNLVCFRSMKDNFLKPVENLLLFPITFGKPSA